MSCQSHSHTHGHGPGDHSHVPPIPTSAAQSLKPQVDLPHVRALNMANPPLDLPLVFRDHSNRTEITPCITSDSDEQLIIEIPFTANIKLYSLILRTASDGCCPRTLKLFKNESVDFDNAETLRPTFTTLQAQVGYAEGDTGDPTFQFVEHFLPRHLFSNVQRLTIFIEDVYGAQSEELKLYSLELRGEFSPLTRDPVITLYEAAANPADHKNQLGAEAGLSRLN